MINSSSIPSSKALGKSVGCTLPWSPPSLCCSLLCCSLPTTSLHMLNVGQMWSFCCLLIFLEEVCTADVLVSVFSFISLQFCYKIGTIHVLLPFRFSKRKPSTAPFLPPWKLPPSTPNRHICNLWGVCVPSFFFHWFLSPLPDAFFYSLKTASFFF